MDNNGNNEVNNQSTNVSPNNVQNNIGRFAIGNGQNTVPATQPVAEQPTQPVAEQPTIQPTVGEIPVTEPIVENANVNPDTIVHSNIPQIITPDTNSSDANAMINENLKKVEINYTPPSKGKIVLLLLFFIALIGFIIFLPNINTLVSNILNNNEEPPMEKITTGRLKCSISTNTTNLDINHNYTFRFTDNKLESLEYVTVTKGDITLDEETLDGLANTCKQLKENVKEIKGVSVQCDYSEGNLEEVQSFDLTILETEKLNAAFTEAGGTLPTYQNGQDIDKIERMMNASKYTCKRER